MTFGVRLLLGEANSKRRRGLDALAAALQRLIQDRDHELPKRWSKVKILIQPGELESTNLLFRNYSSVPHLKLLFRNGCIR